MEMLDQYRAPARYNHHRGQVTTLLAQAGLDPGVTDLVALLRAEAKEQAQGR